MNKNYCLSYFLIVLAMFLFTFSLVKFDNTIKYKSEIASKKVEEARRTKDEKDILDAKVLVDDVIENGVRDNLKKDIDDLEKQIAKEKVETEFNGLLDEIEESLDSNKLNEIKESVQKITYDDIKQKCEERIKTIEDKIEQKRIEEERRKAEEEAERKRKQEAYNRLVNADNEAVYSNVPSDVQVIEYLSGNVTAFTPYCSDGCHGYVASGKYVGDGNIHYYDSTYGKVYIVAGDPSYPLGTIVRLRNVDYFGGRDIYAIVLDRGGAIGKGRRAIFDLLFALEGNANNFGVRYINCEILRLGY